MNSKLQQRIQSAQDEKQFYEAHQLYKTVYYRCTLRKNYAEALDCITKGITFFLENKQWESAIDLACLYIDLLVRSNTDLTEPILQNLCRFLAAMPAETVDRGKYISKCLAVLASNKRFLCSFNEFLGRQLLSEGALPQARSRIMLIDDGCKIGRFLIELHMRYGMVSEVDLFIAQAVLQFLCAKKTAEAALAFYTYTRHHPKLEAGPPFSHFPLLNFIWLVMLTIERKLSYEVLTFLCTSYRSQINRDPSYADYIKKIGQVYFGVGVRSDPFGGIFSSLIRMFGDETDSVDDQLALNMHVDDID